ncbi:hypothetical protein CCY99_07240 [Helicobacter sp. 16-1353]|uniref:glycosyltransferase family 4 protein n=1 Tax=Helicobacter sp. 16-1353 TaxID=2004996 RepID=UPI000DCD85BB|nr:glycosyltransferase family 1 protein [Helicobacter sp. 16-1353]RAX52436.1 hypothetical protein CCY99_07240 [Helicobacter sp. 16-1353]
MCLETPRVLYSHDIFSTQFVGGISRYIFELYSQNANATIPTLYTENLYLAKNKPTKNFKGKTRLIWNLNELREQIALRSKEIDIYHISYYKNLKMWQTPHKIPLVVTVYDMIHEIYANSYFKSDKKTSALKLKNCQQADGIIAISNQTKNDLINLFHIPSQKIQVIYLGHSLSSFSKVDSPKATAIVNLDSPYILFVGSRSGYKNFENFINAISLIHKDYPHIKALCVGSPFNKIELERFNSLDLSDVFISIQAKENELYSIYENALCFVFPSLYEGFGIPIIESFYAKCPTLLSDIAVFREIAQDSALYFNPHEPESIAESIIQAIKNKNLMKEKINLSTKRLELFSWENTYKQTLDFYNKLIREKM